MTTDDPWAAYARLQEMLQFASVSDRSWAIEETMNVLIEGISDGRAVSETQIEDLLSNRSAKYRRRRQHLDDAAGPVFADGARSLETRIELRSRLTRCSERDQSILIAIGSGFTTREIALARVTPEGTDLTPVFHPVETRVRG